jgi:hypothetical protein
MELTDEMLIEDCAELGDFLASYEAGCQVMIEAEWSQAGELELEEVRRRLHEAGQQWRASLNRVALCPAHAIPGLLAKALALHALLTQWSNEAAEVAMLARSVTADLIRLLSGHAPTSH